MFIWTIFTIADITLLCNQESLDAEEVTMRHLKAAIRQARPSEIQMYQELSAKFERLVHSSTVEKRLGSQQSLTRSTGFTFWYISSCTSLFSISCQ